MQISTTLVYLVWNQIENLNDKRTKSKPMSKMKSGPVQWSVKAVHGIKDSQGATATET